MKNYTCPTPPDLAVPDFVVDSSEFDTLSQEIETLTKEIDLNPSPAKSLSISAITDSTTNGSGSLDKILYTLEHHLDRMVQENRIPKSDHGKLFNGNFLGILQNAIQFSLQADANRVQEDNMKLQNNNLKLQALQLKMQVAQLPYQLQQIKADLELKKHQIMQTKMQIEEEKLKLESLCTQNAILGIQYEEEQIKLDITKDQLTLQRYQFQDTVDGKKLGGILKAQDILVKEQTKSYRKNAYNQHMSLLMNGFLQLYQQDPAIKIPASLTSLSIDKHIRLGEENYFSFPTGKDYWKYAMPDPNTYSNYVTDEELNNSGKTDSNGNPIPTKIGTTGVDDDYRNSPIPKFDNDPDNYS